MPVKNPLGEESVYPQGYSRDVLFPVPRADERHKLGVHEALPFHGEDVWNAYEITWLERTGKPVVAAATFRVAADSPNIVESKSLKIYLNALAMERFDTTEDVAALVTSDLTEITGGIVRVELASPSIVAARGIDGFPGLCIDEADVDCDTWHVEPSLLKSNRDNPVSEELYSHLFRSNCPVTGQPDFGSILLRYRGPAIDRGGLLRYLVSYRKHDAFHESCVERIFVDVKKRCSPSALTVYGRFARRGGIDINPFRSDAEDCVDNLRLWRQ